MHRLWKKRVGFCLFILVLLCLYSITIDVYAADKDEGKCRSDIVNKISIDYDGFSVDTHKDMKITVTVPDKGSYEVQYNIVDYGEDAKDIDDSANVKTESISGTSWTHNLAEGKEIFIFVTLKTNLKIGNDTCHAAGTVKINNKGQVTNSKSTWKSESIQNPKESNVGNPIYSSEACQRMREGKYKNNGNSNKKDIVYNSKTESHDYDLGKWNEYAARYFPYCYNPSTTMGFTLSQKNINYVRKELLEIYAQKSQIKLGGITPTAGFNQKVDSTDIDELFCQSKPEKGSDGKYLNNSNKYYYEEDNDIQNSETGQTVCTVTCREELEVIYSPPVAVKAGLCFQYEVTVKSKVQCKTELNSDAEPKPPANSLGAPIAICSGGSDQAGPNDNFDDCVIDCDNGNYSQKCINKCYNKVYKNKTKKSSDQTKTSIKMTNVFDNNANMKLLANSDDDSDDVSYDIPGCKTNSQIYGNQECYKKLTEAKQQNPLGSYKSGNNQYSKANLHWDPDNKDWNDNNLKNYNCRPGGNNQDCAAESYIKSIKRAAPYYFRSVAETADLIKGLHGYYSGKYYKRYIIDNNGIKRQYSSRYQCGEKCGFKGKSGAIYNNKEAKAEYEKSLQGYADALAQCNTAAKCSTDEATFTINVNNDRDMDKDHSCDEHDDNDSKYYHAWKAVNTKNQPGGSPKGDILIFTPIKGDNSDVNSGINGVCYGQEMPWQHYKTTITFPGSWINLKTGEVEFVEKDENEYRKKENYFCTTYDSCDVNVDWWKWDVYGSQLDDDYTPDSYNIGSTVSNFGKYNWNLNISCFYAMSNKAIDDDSMCYRGNNGDVEECLDDSGKKIGEEETKTNYDIRVADTTNLFPKNRLRGYNWGSAAQLKSSDLVISKALTTTGYGVDPVAYSKEVLNKGEKVYDGTADLTIVINSDNIKILKKESLEFEGKLNNKVDNIPGLYYYTMPSSFKNLVGSITEGPNWKKGQNSQMAIDVTK